MGSKMDLAHISHPHLLSIKKSDSCSADAGGHTGSGSAQLVYPLGSTNIAIAGMSPIFKRKYIHRLNPGTFSSQRAVGGSRECVNTVTKMQPQKLAGP